MTLESVLWIQLQPLGGYSYIPSLAVPWHLTTYTHIGHGPRF